MVSRFKDPAAAMQVIGSVFKYPYLLDQEDKYFFNETDFPDELHRIVFGAIYNLRACGAKKVETADILNYLSNRPSLEATFKAHKGEEWLAKVAETANINQFDFYYGRIKKMNLLRVYEDFGVNLDFLYDPSNVTDLGKRQSQEDWLDSHSLSEISDVVMDKMSEIREIFVDNTEDNSSQAGTGVFELIKRLKESPEIGMPLYGDLINAVHRGGRLKKFYLRSAASGVGKTRSMVADACFIACDKMYVDNRGWIDIGMSQPALFISTEQELEEIQTLMLAFISGVNEESILTGIYSNGEEDRVLEAAKIIQASPLYVEELPDFSMQDVENVIRRAIRDLNVSYVFFDYIHTSMKIFAEITQRSGGVKLREDQILLMMAIKLKDICNQLGIFIMSATQLNGDWETAGEANQNLLRGAKALADKADFGSILLNVTQDDLKSLETILGTGHFEIPTVKQAIYKNRRGKYTSVILWCSSDLGTCRINPLFLTNNQYIIQPIENIKVEVVSKPVSAF